MLQHRNLTALQAYPLSFRQKEFTEKIRKYCERLIDLLAEGHQDEFIIPELFRPTTQPSSPWRLSPMLEYPAMMTTQSRQRARRLICAASSRRQYEDDLYDVFLLAVGSPERLQRVCEVIEGGLLRADRKGLTFPEHLLSSALQGLEAVDLALASLEAIFRPSRNASTPATVPAIAPHAIGQARRPSGR